MREKEERSLIFQRPPLGGGYLTIGTLHGDWNNRGIKREGDREGDCLSLRTIGNVIGWQL